MGFENGNVYRVVFRASRAGRDEVNIFHYDGDNHGDPQVNSGQSLANAVANEALSWFAGLYNANWAIAPVVVTDELDPQNPHKARSQWQAGSISEGIKPTAPNRLASAACVVATLKTAHIGRRYTGRAFVGGDAGEANVAANLWDPAWIDAVHTFIDAMPRVPDVAGPASLATCTWSVYSKTQRAQHLDPYLSPVQTILMRNEVHWLRRRENIE